MLKSISTMAVLATTTVAAQDAKFAPPVRLKAGEAFLGENRYFPSPVYHDLDGNGRADVVVGDLVGHLTVAYRAAAANAALFAAEVEVMGADGERVDLQNW